MATLLIVDDDDDVLVASRLLLRNEFADIHICTDPAEISALIDAHSFDAVLLDLNFGPGESSAAQGMHWLEHIHQKDPHLSVVAMTAHSDVEIAVRAVKAGATDFVTKPWENERLLATVLSAVELSRSRREAEQLRRNNRALHELAAPPVTSIVSESPQMADVLEIVAKVAPSDASVLILGENGTGKELIAQEIHRQSPRAEQVFLAVDLGAVTESLFEAELFGHKKGAFTGARTDRLGRFQAAEGGTLFLDEVGNLPLQLQAKLLRALQEGEVTPVGADKPEPTNVRVVAATSVSPQKLRDPEHFRPDLLFRLNTVEIQLPALRERRGDILPIARHYLAINAQKYRQESMSFSSEAELALLDYDWPGNVRALHHAVERAVILAKENEIDAPDLQLPAQVATRASPPSEEGTLSLDQMEKAAINDALRRHGFNISHAAKELGLTRASLYRRMEKHGL
ncbi:MAG: sigma-54 dependent transcriptional regulator [Pseudomonadota bacterium]